MSSEMLNCINYQSPLFQRTALPLKHR